MDRKKTNSIEYIAGRYKWQLIALFHYALSFFYTRGLWRAPEALPLDSMIPLESAVSQRGEYVLHLILSRILGLLLIVGFWYLVGIFFEKGRLKTKQRILFLVLLVLFSAITLIFCEDLFAGELDNYLTLSCAMHNLPFYWHNMWTSVYYGACLMVIPSALGIQLIQVLACCSVLLFILVEIEKHFPYTKAGYGLVFLLLLPEMRAIMAVPYRNNIYTILCLFVVTFLLFRLWDYRKAKAIIHSDNRKDEAEAEREAIRIAKQIVWMTPVLAFVATWRTEGIVLAAGLLVLVMVVFTDCFRSIKLTWKRPVIMLIGFVICMQLFSVPQKIGDKKFFGRDYLIISTLPTIQIILNNPNANLSYPGAAEDISVIDAVADLEGIKIYGVDMFHYMNGYEGRWINQSCTAEKVGSAYMKAVIRMVLHNPKDYIVCQLNNAHSSLGMELWYGVSDYSGEYDWIDTDGTMTRYYEQLGEGQRLRYETPFTKAWEDTAIRIKAYSLFSERLRKYDFFMEDITNVMHYVALLTYVILIGRAIVLGRGKSGLLNPEEAPFWGYYAWAGVVVILEFCAVVAAAPEARTCYYYPTLYTMYIMLTIYLAGRRNEQLAMKERLGL